MLRSTIGKRRSAITFLILSFCFLVSAHAEDVKRSTEYPSPMGIYRKVGITDSLTLGIKPETPGTPANAATSTTTVNGNVTITGNVIVDESLDIGGGLLKVYPLNLWGGTHFTGIKVGGVPQAELEVNGHIEASRFRASVGIGDSDQLLYMGLSSDGAWTEMGAKHGAGWGYVEPGSGKVVSVARFRSSPAIILNGGGSYSAGNVGIGTTNPAEAKLQVGWTGSGLAAGAHFWNNLGSSRRFKTDIEPLGPSDYENVLQKIAGMSMVRFHYKGGRPGQKLRIGILAEEAPPEILTDDKKTQSTADTIGFLLAAVKQLKNENDALEKKVAGLEHEISNK